MDDWIDEVVARNSLHVSLSSLSAAMRGLLV